MSEFLGVRYAAAPVGAMRWMPPVPVGAGKADLDATRAGAGCPQGKSPWGTPSSDEDCLFLSVTVPGDPGWFGFWQKKPVMVWFHGNGFTSRHLRPVSVDPLRKWRTSAVGGL